MSLAVNAGCNILFHHIFGFVGPAIATVFVTVILTAVLADMSARSLETQVWKLIDWGEFLGFVIELILLGTVCFAIKIMLELRGISPIIILCALGGAYITGIFLLNKGKIAAAMREINALH